jgi:hypothetical protein
LLDLSDTAKAHQIDELFAVRVAYQTPVDVMLPKTGQTIEALPNTFEDSLVLTNADHFAQKTGRGLLRKFSKALNDSDSPAALGKKLFDALRDGDKAEFALNVLGDPDFPSLQMPAYMSEGLAWLEGKLVKKQKEILVVPPSAVELSE